MTHPCRLKSFSLKWSFHAKILARFFYDVGYCLFSESLKTVPPLARYKLKIYSSGTLYAAKCQVTAVRIGLGCCHSTKINVGSLCTWEENLAFKNFKFPYYEPVATTKSETEKSFRIVESLSHSAAGVLNQGRSVGLVLSFLVAQALKTMKEMAISYRGCCLF